MGGMLSWLLSIIILLILLGTLAFQLVCLSDLEFDYVNPFDTASRINSVVLLEFATQGTLCFVYLVTGNWCLFLLSLLNLYYNVRSYMNRKHQLDVTEIYNQLHWAKKERLYKLSYSLILFILSLFWIIWMSMDDFPYE